MFWKENSGRQPQLITPENEGGDNTNYPCPPNVTFFLMILKLPLVHKVYNLRRLLNLISLQHHQVRHVYRQDGLQVHHQQVVEKELKQDIHRVSELHPHPRPSPHEPQLIPIPMSDGEDDDDQPERGKDNGLDRVSEYILTYQSRRNHKFNLWLLQYQVMRYQMRIFAIINPSPLSAEQRNRSRRAEKSRSRERVHPRSCSSSHSSQRQQPVVPLPGIQQNQTAQSDDDNSATADPPNYVSNHSGPPQDQE